MGVRERSGRAARGIVHSATAPAIAKIAGERVKTNVAAPLTPDERFRRARLAIAEAEYLANQVTESTPGRERGGLITCTRTQVNAARSALGALTRDRRPDTPERAALRQQAQALLEEAHAALAHARRYSTE